MIKVFIDGSAGTTGLRIHDRLTERKDIELISLPDDTRKDVSLRKKAMNDSDIIFLCLPDAAAIEAASFITNTDTVVIDTSTAHRVSPDWTYGFPEIFDLKEKIKISKRIANPGCHASGFIALVAPLVDAGIINNATPLSCFSLTGYSGGGKTMIAEYENHSRLELLSAPRMYGLSQMHKHLPEMQKICGLKNPPIFCPVVADYYSGMEVVVPLFDVDIEAVKEIYKNYYSVFFKGDFQTLDNAQKNAVCKASAKYPKPFGLVYYAEDADEDGFMSAQKMSGHDSMQVSVTGNNERALLIARFDNLGKGASGAAIQNMNIVLGLPDDFGLVI